ncbi:MAG: 16S rRNA (guanine(527)-N(7))-methyltransferase RsmG [Chlorobiaceae bacterium]
MERLKNNLLTLKTLCAEQGIDIDPLMLQKLVRYGDCLEQWNRRINLISRKEDAPIIIKHIFHALLITLYHSFRKEEQVLDLGTGGGLPGIPLAIAFPETQFLLVDATRKKITACQEMIKELDLSNAVAIHTRVEELKGVLFDTVLSRQVASLDKLCDYAGRLLKPKGILICLKGGNLETEISKALTSSNKHNGFPSRIKQHPIHETSQFFSEKHIVIASR